MSDSTPAALVIGKIQHAQASWDALGPLATLLTPNATSRAELLAEFRSGRFDNVKVVYRTFESAATVGCFDAELIEALPKSVEFVCHNGAGYDQVDVAACAARDPPIRVSNVLGAVDDSTADTAIFLILGALRNFMPPMLAIRAGKWRDHPDNVFGHDPRGKTLGIIGMGRIGRDMKPKVEVFGMKVIYYNRNRLSEELAAGAEYVELDELLAQSDVISMNLPLNAHTRHTISDAQFAKMKDGVVIVNTARGAVIDEAALVRALDSGKVAGCGLDVFENEPEVHPSLVDHPRALILPHMGTNSVETQQAMEEQTIGNVRSVLETGKLVNVVPEHDRLGLGP